MLLLLLHGLGACAAVWQPFVDVLARARRDGADLDWHAPDLAGHGGAPHDPPYGYSRHAAAVAAGLPQGRRVVVIGHSMGAMVGIALASGDFGIDVAGVVGLSVKLAFTDDELSRARRFGAAPVRWFDTAAAARERYLQAAGLAGLVAPDGPIAQAGVVEQDGRFRLACDPRNHLGIGMPAGRFAGAMRAPLRLLAGADDPLVSLADLQGLDPRARLIDGLGHNLHVQAPAALWQALQEPLSTMTSPP